MTSNLVSDWFGEGFTELHPLLQQIHKTGGTLSGTVTVNIASGLAGFLGRRIAKGFSIPINSSDHFFTVAITHQSDAMHWNRMFNSSQMYSVFLPVGNKADGYWLESTGSVHLYLTVDIKDKGWYWRCLKARFKYFTVPLFFLPRINAYKKIENEKYRFYVGFSLLFFGEVLSYGGLLDPHLPVSKC